MADVRAQRRPREGRPGARVSPKTAFFMTSHNVEVGHFRDRPKHRIPCSTIEEELAAATVMDGFALPAIDALPCRNAISKVPRAAGYRVSDFVLWHSLTVPSLGCNFGRSWGYSGRTMIMAAPPFGRSRPIARQSWPRDGAALAGSGRLRPFG